MKGQVDPPGSEVKLRREQALRGAMTSYCMTDVTYMQHRAAGGAASMCAMQTEKFSI